MPNSFVNRCSNSVIGLLQLRLDPGDLALQSLHLSAVCVPLAPIRSGSRWTFGARLNCAARSRSPSSIRLVPPLGQAAVVDALPPARSSARFAVCSHAWRVLSSQSPALAAGENVIAAIGAKIDSQSARIDVLQRVIWPLIGLLTTTVFGLLYRVVIATPG